MVHKLVMSGIVEALDRGDLLSPLLFVLVLDVLSTLFNNMMNSGILQGIVLSKSGVKTCYLQFADDLLIMTIGGRDDL